MGWHGTVNRGLAEDVSYRPAPSRSLAGVVRHQLVPSFQIPAWLDQSVIDLHWKQEDRGAGWSVRSCPTLAPPSNYPNSHNKRTEVHTKYVPQTQ